VAIECVFFDFDGVLRNWGPDMSGIEGRFGIPFDEFAAVAFSTESIDDVIRGKTSDEEWRADVAQRLAERFPERDTAEVSEYWAGTVGDLVPEILSIINECKTEAKVALFSNATSRLNSDMESLGISGLFDYVVNTSDVGSIKPECEIYQYALKLAGIEAHQAFFTDDKSENVEAAIRLDWSGYHFESATGLRAALVEAGVL
jgi:putative hydrolase of the HAD superfamily